MAFLFPSLKASNLTPPYLSKGDYDSLFLFNLFSISFGVTLGDCLGLEPSKTLVDFLLSLDLTLLMTSLI
jgi:hypothetical protein